jgi:hypothetical protein
LIRKKFRIKITPQELFLEKKEQEKKEPLRIRGDNMIVRIQNTIKFDDIKNHSIFEMPSNISFKDAPNDPEDVNDPEGPDDTEDVCADPNKKCNDKNCTKCKDKKCSDVVPSDAKPEDKKVQAKNKKCSVQIDMLRTGKFIRKSWFSDNQIIDITEPMMDLMIKNFTDGVMPQGVALDTNHRGEEAYGWLTDLTKEKRMVKGHDQTFLIGTFELTDAGKQIINSETYKFFSIEFSPNMTQKEIFQTTKNSEGKEIPLGDVKNYGPTIIGGALTNRPFIPDMKAVPLAFSDKSVKNDLNQFSFIAGDESVTLESDQKATSGVSSKAVVNFDHSGRNKNNSKNAEPVKAFSLSGFSFNSKKEKNIMFSTVSEVIKFMESKLSTLDKDSTEFSEVSASLKKAKEELAFAQDEMKKKEESIKSNTVALNDLASKVVSLENSAQETAKELALSKERARQADVNQYCDGLTTKGFPKPTVTMVKDLLLSDRTEAEVLKFGEAKTPMKVRDIIGKVLDTFPTDAKVPLGENLNFSTSELKDPNSDEKIKSESQKLSEKFADAIDSGHKKGISGYTRKKKSDVETPPAEKI